MKIIANKKNNVEIGDIVLYQNNEKLLIPDDDGNICLLDLKTFRKITINESILEDYISRGELKLLIKYNDIIIEEHE
ncbi:hypothetical protein [Peptostreptococcus sp. D1]|uniref:hypothetical protein n=1 Tax=Peptostreptococcus sp. D1 TaxID=72304 RepID=UPI0008F2D682|nr:hypothetical protein [Peptostreptococcus sp. D1]SFE84727.1 hypothetical protein SAMN02910278_01871 [Peptostreptococcus sp. D1]